MKTFSINIHYDVVQAVEINAESEEEALEAAKQIELETLENCDVDVFDACVTDETETI